MINKNKFKDYYMNIEACVSAIKTDPSNSNIQDLKDELNKYFFESICKIYIILIIVIRCFLVYM